MGLRGPGETKIETDRRRIRERMAKLRREIKGMKQVRDTQRGRRLRSDVPSIAIVGYTNAGQVESAERADRRGVLVQDALFATLEPTTRRGQFDDGRHVRAHRHGGIRPASADPARRGVPLDARRRSSTPTCWCMSSTARTPTRWRRSTRCARSSATSSPIIDGQAGTRVVGRQQGRRRKRFGDGQAAACVARSGVRLGAHGRGTGPVCGGGWPSWRCPPTRRSTS